MNKTLFTVFAFSIFALSLNAQEPSSKKVSSVKITYHSQQEKKESIKQQREKLKINKSDPTYPKDLLANEVKALEASENAIIINSKK
jgi:hypothetical protein